MQSRRSTSIQLFDQKNQVMLIKIKDFLLLLVAVAACSAHAGGYDVRRFQSFTKLGGVEKERDISYLVGVSRGLVLSSMYSNRIKGEPLFCIPNSRFDEAYGGSISILQSEIATPSHGKPYAQDTPIEAVMLQAFVTSYPCSK